MYLRVVTTPEPELELLAEPRVRPGDWREPVAIDPPAEFAAAAASRRLAFELAVTVVVERALCLADLRALGVGEVAARAVLNAAVERTRVVPGPGDARLPYLRALAGDGATAPRGATLLPIRLHPRLTGDVLAAALVPEHLGEACAWERAAVCEARLMAEWAFAAALAEQPARLAAP